MIQYISDKIPRNWLAERNVDIEFRLEAVSETVFIYMRRINNPKCCSCLEVKISMFNKIEEDPDMLFKILNNLYDKLLEEESKK